MQGSLPIVRRGICKACRNLAVSKQVKSCAPLVSFINTSQHREMASSSKIGMTSRLKGTEKNIWVEFGAFAKQYDALNLGQGFPDFKPPDHVVEQVFKALSSDNALLSQYTRSYGHPRLVNVLAELYSPITNHKIDPMTDIIAGIGGYGVLFCAVQGLVNPGDEVVIIEPYFDCYEPMVKVAGGTPLYVPLRPAKKEGTLSSADWKLDPVELESKFSSKTKAIIINNPNNPVGKVFSEDELQMIADLCIKYDTICISDEVYEWLIFDGLKHTKIASLPGMWDRTVTVGSGGKTFSATGWKLGWGIGPQKLIQPMQILHQNCVYTCPTPIQEAVAAALEYELSVKDDPEKCYLRSLATETQVKRDRLIKQLVDLGMTVTIPEGGYFLVADYSNIKFTDDKKAKDYVEDEPKDYKFVKWMTRQKGLAAIPPSAFYSEGHKDLGENFVRFCFIKKDETLEKAGEILKAWKETL